MLGQDFVIDFLLYLRQLLRRVALAEFTVLQERKMILEKMNCGVSLRYVQSELLAINQVE